MNILSEKKQVKKDISGDNSKADATRTDGSQKMRMLQGIVEIGEIAYNEEQIRKKSLIEQSSSMIIVITLLITLLGILLQFVNESQVHISV